MREELGMLGFCGECGFAGCDDAPETVRELTREDLEALLVSVERELDAYAEGQSC